MRILIIHNQLWAHYKSKLFSEIYKAIKQDYPKSVLKVAQISPYEKSRKGMVYNEGYTYEYPYQLLFDACLEEIPFTSRLKALFRQFHEFKPTVLNITGYFDWAQVLLMFYAKLRGVRVVLSSESSSDDHNRHFLKEQLKKFIVNRADSYFCFGTTSANYLESLGVNKRKITVKNAAVIDDEIIRYKYVQATEIKNDNGITFIYVGRLSKEKNLNLLIKAFINSVNTFDTNLNLKIVGTGPQKKELESIASEYPQISFEGSKPWYEIPNYLAKSDVLILPSKSEPWGLVVNEAMICGMPVIVSTKCGCVVDLVKNKINGFTFEPTNQKELEDAMSYFIKEPTAIRKMGQASVEIIKPFSVVKVARAMVNQYHLLSKN